MGNNEEAVRCWEIIDPPDVNKLYISYPETYIDKNGNIRNFTRPTRIPGAGTSLVKKFHSIY